MLPAQLRSSSLARHALRAPAKGMTKAADAAVEKAKRRKDKGHRALVRETGFLGAVKVILQGWAPPTESEECEQCLARQGPRQRPAA